MLQLTFANICIALRCVRANGCCSCQCFSHRGGSGVAIATSIMAPKLRGKRTPNKKAELVLARARAYFRPARAYAKSATKQVNTHRKRRPRGKAKRNSINVCVSDAEYWDHFDMYKETARWCSSCGHMALTLASKPGICTRCRSLGAPPSEPSRPPGMPPMMPPMVPSSHFDEEEFERPPTDEDPDQEFEPPPTAQEPGVECV